MGRTDPLEGECLRQKIISEVSPLTTLKIFSRMTILFLGKQGGSCL